MDSKEIIKGNKLIAEFMGIPKCERCEDCGGYQYSPAVIYLPNEMKYATSFDWLMEVVDKIEASGYEFEIRCGVVRVLEVNQERDRDSGFIFSVEKETRLDSVWAACVQWIKHIEHDEEIEH